jgi:hypothetical protein
MKHSYSYAHEHSHPQPSSGISVGQLSVGKSKIFYSMAKLCGKIAAGNSNSSSEEGTSTAAASVLSKQKSLPFLSPTTTATPVKKTTIVLAQVMSEKDKEVQREIQKELTFIRIQEDIQQYLPIELSLSSFPRSLDRPAAEVASSSSSSGSRTPVVSRGMVIIEEMIHFLQTYRKQQNEQDLQSMKPTTEKTTKTKKKSGGKQHQQQEEEEEERVYYPPIENEILIKTIGEVLRVFEMEKTIALTSKYYQLLCLLLWKEILLLNEHEWLNYSMISLMTKEMEKEMKAHCLLYALLYSLSQEERQQQLQTGKKEKEPSSLFWFSPVHNLPLLEKMIEESGLTKKYMNEDGEILPVKESSAPNERVMKIILSCVNAVKQDVDENSTTL